MNTAEFSKRAAIFIGLALIPFLVWHLFNVVLIAVGAVLIATLLSLVAEPFIRLRLPRSVALVASGLVVAAVLFEAAYLFGTGVGFEMQEVMRRVEEAQQTITQSMNNSQIGKTVLSHLQGQNVPVGQLIGGLFHISAAFLVAVVVTVFAGVYLAAQPALYLTGFGKLFPPQWRENADETLDHLAQGLRLWMLGQLLEMLIIGVLSGLAVWMIGLPSPLALGVIAGVAEFVPYLGPIVAAVPAVLVAITLNSTAVLWTLTAYVLIHQAEGQVVMPIIQRRMVFIPPALMLMSILAIGSLWGVSGTIFAAPITVILFVLVTKLYVRDSLGEPAPLPGEPEAAEQNIE
ncbi:AI-2E family transporter [Methylocystis heyeri]|uniref:AI-2E family transporter n=1 Tax=Methylocystis heyeri TaxID=391905 RepID=A0A6B8KHU3_9HYPH|nr:AI-2E family transporter [Methylocystis heyeri]QGM47179.1 AI-2E family transporter [Methylocystis heyeri]